MRDLRLVAVSEDGNWLVLSSDSGEQLRLPIDERLRAALRGDRARLGQLQMDLDSPLTPRDIQARIRAGESAEELALAAGVPVEKIRRYEGPILAERQHAVEEAQRAAVRRAASTDRGDQDGVFDVSGPVPRLGALVEERLGGHGVDTHALNWDAWRRDDGRWQLRLDYRAGGRDKHASFVYDPAGKFVVADDDEARWVVGETAAPSPAGAGNRRLRSVGRAERDTDEAAATAETAADSAADTDTAAAADTDTAAAADTDTADSADTDTADSADTVDTDTADTAAVDTDTAATAATAAAAAAVDTDEPAAAEGGDDTSADTSADTSSDTATDSPAETQPPAPPRPSKRKRPHVPSWDEIVFGAKKSE
jgi:hypothetical protein